MKRTYHIGVDVGSATISYSLLDDQRRVVDSGYMFHHGDIHHHLRKLIERISPERIRSFGINREARPFLRNGVEVDDQVAIIEGVKVFSSDMRAILNIGAEKFGLILFDSNGMYSKFISNTGCAAGTGSFLDQQAVRLGLKESKKLVKLAEKFNGDPPRIATRCAVFAKTDLIHAQQKGYTLEAICRGLCLGAARNIIETVTRGNTIPEPYVITGGVALNHVIVSYIKELTGKRSLEIPLPERVASIGAALIAAERSDEELKLKSVDDFVKSKPSKRKYFYAPLSDIPYRMDDSQIFRRFVKDGIETEIFIKPVSSEVRVYLGIDIGSTSTKATLMSEDRKILVGLYTRTMGQPVRAVQKILKMIKKIEKEYGISYRLIAAGTTGSGRKFIHTILKTDRAVDEISAHARAAYHLKPDVDTIIEIGGQDSKFTVINRGRLVFSRMNYVCAAGTGSFLEEQAGRLGYSLEKYSNYAEKARAPLTSDRCTVFMERDLNYLLSLGYAKEELLAAALHSVRDNYLTKVAHQNKIGSSIVFQGATGKNRALVKSFEQKLGKPVFVSPYCHLTGAIGVCLILQDMGITLNKNFRHDFAREKITLHEDVCNDCSNHCKITIINIKDERVVWGRLCGRDSETPTISFKGSDNLKKIRNTIFKYNENIESRMDGGGIKIGIPNTLYFMDTLPMWRYFFKRLGYRVVLSNSLEDTLTVGKNIAGAEFCSPISLLHGHVKFLLDRSDYCFMPVIFQDQRSGDFKTYCYYSNYAVSLILNNKNLNCSNRIIAPMFTMSNDMDQIFESILKSLPKRMRALHDDEEIKSALIESCRWYDEKQRMLLEEGRKILEGENGVVVALLGRPYLVLDNKMNNHLLPRLDNMGLRVIYQDMLLRDENGIKHTNDYIRWNHWLYGDRVLKSAEIIGKAKNLFPIYVTAFKCSPDSFIIPYFREIMDRYDKPYLILQMDEHQSVEGYETRLEAAVETFRNYHYKIKKVDKIYINVKRSLEKKTYLLPNYDPLSTRLMTAAFRKHGIRALPIMETEKTVKASIRLNDGQCLPVSAIVQAIAHTIEVYRLNPRNVAIFLNALCQISCNLPQYPIFIKQLLRKINSDFSGIDVFVTTTEMIDLKKSVLIDIYQAYLLGGLLQKMGCKVRPRELNRGVTDALLQQSVDQLASAIETGGSRERLFKEIVLQFLEIRQDRSSQLPKVAIVGDLYVRDNHIFNQNLIRVIEDEGAEVITTPYNFLVRLMAAKHFSNLAMDKKYLNLIVEKALLTILSHFDKKYFEIARPVLREDLPEFSGDLLTRLSDYHLTSRHGGESVQNVMKIFHLIEHHPDIKLFVHINPVFCCPALVSESIFKRIEEETGIPIVSITYDGTQTPHNNIVIPYIHFLKRRIGSGV